MKNFLSGNFFILIFLLTLSGCGGGSNDTSAKQGTVEVGISDAPVDNAEAVVVHFTQATLHGPDGNTIIAITDPVTGLPGRSIDLLLFQSGQWSGFFSQTVTAGNYSWIRLEIDFTKSYIQIGGAQYALSCTSCSNNGLQLNRSFTVPADATLALMLDFDLRKSITLPNNGSQIYKLRPTIRIVETAASGSVSGTVDPTLVASLGGDITGCSVYVFNGSNATPDDIYIPFSGSLPVTQNNPVSSTRVITATNGDYIYTAAFLPAGNFTVALTCDAKTDHADTDDTLTFASPINTSVLAGQTSTVDFPAPGP